MTSGSTITARAQEIFSSHLDKQRQRIDQIMAGQIDPLIDALLDLDKQQRLESL